MAMKRLIWTGVLLVLFTGCVTTTDEEGNTKRTADPNSVDAIANIGIAIGRAASVAWPPAAGITAALAAAYAAYRKKIKPKVDKAESEANLYHTTSSWLVETIEQLKRDQPAQWEKIKPLFKENKWSSEVEAVIEALRGGDD